MHIVPVHVDDSESARVIAARDVVAARRACLALARLAVERRFRPDVIADVGDGDVQRPAVAVRLRMHRIVMVARVGGIDGDQRQVPQVLPTLERGEFLIRGLGPDLF